MRMRQVSTHFLHKHVGSELVFTASRRFTTTRIESELNSQDVKERRRLVLERIREKSWSCFDIAGSFKYENNPLSIFLKNRRQWYRSSTRWRKENEEVAIACTHPDILRHLTRSERWSLLDTLYHTRNTMSRFVRSHCVSQILLHTHGEDLTWLKLRIDSGREFQQQQEQQNDALAKTWATRLRRAVFPSQGHEEETRNSRRRVMNNFDLQYVVLKDLIREHQIEVLQHFALSALDIETPMIKVLSDIDDTVVAGFKDDRIPSSTIYPGAISFLTSIMHCSNKSRNLSQNNLPVAFLTARPSGIRQSLAGYTRRQLRKQTQGSALDSGGVTVLAGSVSTGLNHSRIAKMKLRNFVLHKSLYPECKFVFVGDNGQGDALLARDMIEKYPDRVRGTFIHRIEDKEEEELEESTQTFRTYAEATRMAFETDLLSGEFALNVLQDCETEMKFLSLSAGSNKEQAKRLECYSKILREDIELARATVVSRTDE